MKEMLSTEILAELEIGTNLALGLPKAHGFGWHFISNYVDDPVAFHVDPEWMQDFCPRSTDYEAMREWYAGLGTFDGLKLTERHHSVLMSILGIIQALLGVELIHEKEKQSKTEMEAERLNAEPYHC